MASSSYFSTSNPYVKYWIIVDQQSQSIEGNSSTIRVRVQFWRTNSGYETYGSGTLWCKIDGSWYSASVSPSQKINGTITLFDRTVTVGHNADGSKSVYVSAYIEMNTPLSSNEQGFWVGLSTIPRRSTISFGDFTFGSTGTITINRASSGFTHTVKFVCGKYSGTIASGTSATQLAWTPPRSYIDAVTNSTRCVGSLQVLTYNGGSYVGETTQSCTIYVPGDVVPTISDFTATAVSTSVPSDWGMYVQSKSQCSLRISGASGVYGSTITGYSIKRDGTLLSTEATAQTGVLGAAGDVTYEATVTDSRGRTVTRRVTIRVESYNSPGFARVISQRCTSSGTQDDEGTYVKGTVTPSYTPLGGKNQVSVVYAYRQTGGQWSADASISGSAVFGSGTISAEQTYEIRYKVTDLLGGTAEYIDHISTAFSLMDFKHGGKGMAIGKVAQQDGHLEVGLITDFLSDVNVQAGGNSVNLGGTIQDIKNQISTINNNFFQGRNNRWESTDWLSNGKFGVYWMTPSDNPTNHPFPGRWGWMLNLQTLRIAVPYNTGEVYTAMYANSAWTGWKTLQDDIKGVGRYVTSGKYGSTWTLSTAEYWDIGNKMSSNSNEFASFSGGTSSNITILKQGTYLITLESTVLATNSGGNQVEVQLVVNGAEKARASYTIYTSGSRINATWVYTLNAGDSVAAKMKAVWDSVKNDGTDRFTITRIDGYIR